MEVVLFTTIIGYVNNAGNSGKHRKNNCSNTALSACHASTVSAISNTLLGHITLDEKIFEQIFTCIKIRGVLYDTRKTAPVRVYTYTPNISKILSEILACHFCDEMKKIYLQGKIFELIAVYCDEVICKSPTNDFGIRISVEDYNALLKAREFIGENFAHPLTIPIVAKAIAINEQKLKDGFKRCFGVTVNDYVVEKRLEAAIRLLKTGKHTVQEVTWMVGYSHTGYFIELFRKHYGISPGEMLKNNR